jgi:hypothetical protein
VRVYFSFPTVTCSAFKQGVTRSWPEATYVVVRYIILRERVDRTDATMAGTVSLPFLGKPTVRVRRVPNVERLQVVLQDVFVHLGGVSSAHAAKRIRTAREKIGRDVVIHQVREGPNTLLATTLTDAVDMLIEVDVPAARELRHQLIQLGKLVVGGDPDGTVATEIQANKQLLEAMEPQERSLFKELMLPDDFKHSMQVHVLCCGVSASQLLLLRLSQPACPTGYKGHCYKQNSHQRGPQGRSVCCDVTASECHQNRSLECKHALPRRPMPQILWS